MIDQKQFRALTFLCLVLTMVMSSFGQTQPGTFTDLRLKKPGSAAGEYTFKTDSNGVLRSYNEAGSITASWDPESGEISGILAGNASALSDGTGSISWQDDDIETRWNVSTNMSISGLLEATQLAGDGTNINSLDASHITQGLGTVGQVPRVASGGSSLEWFTPSAIADPAGLSATQEFTGDNTFSGAITVSGLAAFSNTGNTDFAGPITVGNPVNPPGGNLGFGFAGSVNAEYGLFSNDLHSLGTTYASEGLVAGYGRQNHSHDGAIWIETEGSADGIPTAGVQESKVYTDTAGLHFRNVHAGLAGEGSVSRVFDFDSPLHVKDDIATSGSLSVGSSNLPTYNMAVGADLGDIGMTSVDSTLVIGNTSHNSCLALGQDSTHQLQFRWDYNGTASSAIANLVTWGYGNPLKIDVSALSLNTVSGGDVTVGSTLALPGADDSTHAIAIGGAAKLYDDGATINLIGRGYYAFGTNSSQLYLNAPVGRFGFNNGSFEFCTYSNESNPSVKMWYNGTAANRSVSIGSRVQITGGTMSAVTSGAELQVVGNISRTGGETMPARTYSSSASTSILASDGLIVLDADTRGDVVNGVLPDAATCVGAHLYVYGKDVGAYGCLVQSYDGIQSIKGLSDTAAEVSVSNSMYEFISQGTYWLYK